MDKGGKVDVKEWKSFKKEKKKAKEAKLLANLEQRKNLLVALVGERREDI